MSKRLALVQVGSERPKRKKKHLDRLTRDAIAAERAGMSYGKWKALHPHTPDEDDEEPAPLTMKGGQIMKTCAQCGQEFAHDPRKPARLYCSDECRIKHYEESRHQGYKKRACMYCEAEFTPTTSNQVFCCYACRVKYNNGVRPPRGPCTGKTTQCVRCGKDFVMKGSQKKYCSVECYAESMRERKAARRLKEKQEGKRK